MVFSRLVRGCSLALLILSSFLLLDGSLADRSRCQILGLKELESYGPYPPMQGPETYNLTQVIQQIKNQHSASHAGEYLANGRLSGRLASAAR